MTTSLAMDGAIQMTAVQEALAADTPKPRLVLLSRSPRRRQFLLDAGIEHHAVTPQLEDSQLEPGLIDPARWVSSLAYLKARSGLDWFWDKARYELGSLENWLLLGADTACVLQGRLVGTPRDADEAKGMLESFSGATHQVVTGVALIDPHTRRRWVFHDSATVEVGELGPQQIDEYIRTGGWEGKAGAYNLSERMEAGWPLRCVGDPTTVMGLPMRALKSRLDKLRRRERAA